MQSASGCVADADERYAELWMGTHSSGPSRVADSGVLLSDHIGEDLPYLFKVLMRAHVNLPLTNMIQR